MFGTLLRNNYVLCLILIYRTIIPDKKKETHHYDFPVKFTFNYENANCHKILNFDLISLKLKRGVDENLCFPHAGTETSL